jgi:hypothetical protein
VEQVTSAGSSTCSFPSASRPSGEDVEDELRAIDDLALNRRLDAAQLRRRELASSKTTTSASFRHMPPPG